jgi:L-serine dehydratase
VQLSVFDLFKVGIGPSSSHTVGPMRAAARFAARAAEAPDVVRVRAELFGSLGLTGRGHGSDRAVILGLMGEDPETVDVDAVASRCAAVAQARALALSGTGPVVAFDPASDLVLHRRERLPFHTNGLRFRGLDADGDVKLEAVFYSVGGGFVVDGEGAPLGLAEHVVAVPHPFATAEELLARCDETGCSISTLLWGNEVARCDAAEVQRRLDHLARVMEACIDRGCSQEGILPGGLKVRRRAAQLHRRLKGDAAAGADPLTALDHVNLWALAVNEENAAGGRVVTAPTNGAAGILPSVLRYYRRFVPGADEEGVRRFLLAAGAIGMLYKTNASISGAEVGCQGEVGVACSMAAAGLVEAQGGTPAQVENAAEIGMEHNLGLTCDPVGGLVQVPCIERNAMGAVKAINAARLALSGDGSHKVSLDKVIATMRQTGADMSQKYKETARGGLAVNLVEC